VKRLNYENGKLDDIDARLLTALVANARVATTELARIVGLSPPSVAERVKRLDEAGVITGYAAQIDPIALGLPLALWLRIRPVPGKLAQVAEIIRAIPEITTCDRVTGEDCFVARAYVPSVSVMEKLIDQIIPYAMTNTSVIQSSPVERRLPPIQSTAKD
jgi:Lrp/AsnC family leucine-responsive transcriptional regulator